MIGERNAKMLPLSRKDIIDILKTHKFKSTQNHYKELIIICKYCIDHGMSQAYVYNLWCKMWRDVREYSDDVVRQVWPKFWHMVNETTILQTHKIVVYQEELDAINKYVMPLWAKKYMLLLLSYFKINGYTGRISVSPRKKLMSLIDGGYDSDDVYYYTDEAWVKKKLMKRQFNEWEDERTGEPRSKIMYSLPFMRQEGTVAFEEDSLYDVVNQFWRVENKKKCKQCKTVFACSVKSQTDLCPECLHKQNNKKALLRMQKLRKARCSGQNEISL